MSPLPRPRTATSPLDAVREGLRLGGSLVASPLVSTRMAISFHGGLASVAVSRTFRNDGSFPVEAVLTFPVPTSAAVHGLAVKVGDRVVRARSLPRDAARTSYEAAVDDGLLAVLHEETMKGIHVVSVGQLAPGVVVEVGVLWAQPLRVAGARAELRVPTTVGEIYGHDPAEPSDRLVTGAPRASATLSLAGLPVGATLCGAPVVDGDVTVDLDVPVSVSVPVDAVVSDLLGRSPDGSVVRLRTAPRPAGEGDLDVAVLFDRSSSTASPFDATSTRPLSTHRAAALGLSSALSALGPRDRASAWWFHRDVGSIGSAHGPAAGRLLSDPPGPHGGTEAGLAVAHVAAHDAARDILVVTDGLSHAVDVQALSGLGRRVSALLCGAQSLDARLSQLVAATGGDVIVVGSPGDTEADVALAAGHLLSGMRSSPALGGGAAPVPGGDSVHVRGGLILHASREPSTDGDPRAIVVPAVPALLGALGSDVVDPVAAYAAHLSLPHLTREAATALATSHGLCSHLTSLLLVDVDGPAVAGVPSQRKVALPTPRAASAALFLRASGSAPGALPRLSAHAGRASFLSSPPTAPSRPNAPFLRASPDTRSRDVPAAHRAAPAPASSTSLASLALRLDFDLHGPALSTGDASGLAPDDRRLLTVAAAHPLVVSLASAAGVPAVAVVAALMAESASGRTAARIARMIPASPAASACRRALGLPDAPRP